MEKIHVIFVGDSFSDDGRNTDVFDTNYLINDNFSGFSLGLPNTIKIHSFFASDVINQNKNCIIHTIARGSYGNHVITDKLKSKVIEIKEKYSNDKIYAIIQFSSFIRKNFNGNVIGIDIKDYPFDYPFYSDYTTISDEKIIFEKHFDNIENIDLFCKLNDVDAYMFFGWANIFEYDIKKYNLYERIERIKNIVNFQKYEDCDDEIRFYCAGGDTKKPTDLYSYGSNKLFRTSGDLYGGLTEYTRKNLPIGKRYNFLFDPHPSTYAFYLFYTDVIKKWFISKNILSDIPIKKDVQDIIQIITNFEYNRFKLIIDGDHPYIHNIMDISYHLIRKNLITDIEVCNKIFYELNNAIKNNDDDKINHLLNNLIN